MPVIALNALYLKPGLVGGTERYLRELIPEITRLRPDWDWDLHVCRNAVASLEGLPGSFRLVPHAVDSTHRIRRILAEQFGFPRKLKDLGTGIVLNLGSSALNRMDIPQVSMIHDLQHRHLPGNFGTVERAAIELTVRLAVARSRRCLTPSHTVKDDLVRLFGIPENHVSVTPLAASKAFHWAGSVPADECPADISRGFPRPFVLSPAALRPHKDLWRLCEIFAGTPACAGMELVLTGAPGPEQHRLVSHPLFRSGRARYLGWLPEPVIPWVYRLARAIVLPTQFEGFCLPVLEGFATGTPVVASDLPVIREVAGEAALLVPAGDVQAGCQALGQVLTELSVRERLILEGREQAGRFSWKRTAELTLDVLQQAMA